MPVDATTLPAPRLARRQAGFEHSLGVLGDQPGIRFLEVRVPPGTARRVGRFYEEMLGARVVFDAEGHGVVVALGRETRVRAARERPQILDAVGIVGFLQARFRAERVAAMQEGHRLPSGKPSKRRRVWRRPRQRRRF